VVVRPIGITRRRPSGRKIARRRKDVYLQAEYGDY